jgi:hypothetical protein
MRKHHSYGPIYAICRQAQPGADGIRALRATLKVLRRRHHVRRLDAREKRPASAPVVLTVAKLSMRSTGHFLAVVYTLPPAIEKRTV